MRALEFAGQIALPRWALALSGIAVVMAALAWFQLPPETAPAFPGFVVMAATTFLLGRDWRAALSAALCAALLWLFHLDAGLPFLAVPVLLLAGAARLREEEGSESWRSALEEWAAPLVFAMMGGVLLMALTAAIPFWLTGAWGTATVVTALVFFPALTAALWRDGLAPEMLSQAVVPLNGFEVGSVGFGGLRSHAANGKLRGCTSVGDCLTNSVSANNKAKR
jgi:hypothetical protein